MRYRNGLQRMVACLLLCAVAVGLFIAPIFAVSVPASEQTVPVGRQVCIVRYRPNGQSLVIGCLDNGSEVTVLGEKDAYYQIDCYDMTGYVAKTQVALHENGKSYIYCIPNSPETTFLPTVEAQALLQMQDKVRTAGISMCGTPYVLGGNSRWGIDCSGLTRYAYARAGMYLNWIAQEQLANGIIVAKEDMQCGDLVFFERTSDNGRIATHVGIYVGNGKMVHAGTSNGVVVVDLSISYFEEHYLCARRVILTDADAYEMPPLTEVTNDINSSYWRENSQTQTESGNSFEIPLKYIKNSV